MKPHFLKFLFFYVFHMKNVEKHISPNIWSAQHPNTGHNIQQNGVTMRCLVLSECEIQNFQIVSPQKFFFSLDHSSAGKPSVA